MKERIDKFLINNYKLIKSKQEEGTLKWKEICSQIPVSGDKSEYVRGRFRKIKENVTPLSNENEFDYISGKENSEIKEFIFSCSRIPTEDEIINHFNIDTTKYRINQIYHKTSFGGKYAITVSLLSNKQGQLTSEFEKAFEKFCNNQSLKVLKSNPIKENDFKTFPYEKDCTVVINLADLHLGKLVSEHETGERYNIDIAKERFLTCIRHLAYKSYQCYGIKKFILSSLGDTLHTDTVKSTTTSGTYVESDTRASKVFEVALEVLTESIDILKQFADEVEFININGNHCELSEQHLGIALKAYYRNEKSIIINAEPKVRKTILVGDNLLSWSHGDCNMNTLPLTIATESSELWGKSKFRLIQLGHLHGTKKKVFQAEDEFNGVIVRHFSSLSGTDSWHNKNNYIGNQKRGTALVFSDDEVGIIGEFYKTI